MNRDLPFPSVTDEIFPAVIFHDRPSQNSMRVKAGKKVRASVALGLFIFMSGGFSHAGEAVQFFTQKGNDPSFSEVLKSGDLPRGQNSTKGFKGSRVSVNHSLLDDGPNARRKIPANIKIHTLGNSMIPRNSFSNWSRWYQEDGNTQIFRLFEGEENVRNSRAKAARIEAFSDLKWKRGDWQEWVGTYTIIKPHGAAIFQVKNNENDWGLMLGMSSTGNVTLNHRRGQDKVIAQNMIGKPFHIRVRDNGHDYELYLNGKLEGTGSYDRPGGETSFRWGMYLGAKDVQNDAMILVTGAGINPNNYDPGKAIATGTKDTAPVVSGPETHPPLKAPDGLPIPGRIWTNANGIKVRATGVYQIGSDVVYLRIDDQWIPYKLKDLSENDREELGKAALFAE